MFSNETKSNPPSIYKKNTVTQSDWIRFSEMVWDVCLLNYILFHFRIRLDFLHSRNKNGNNFFLVWFGLMAHGSSPKGMIYLCYSELSHLQRQLNIVPIYLLNFSLGLFPLLHIRRRQDRLSLISSLHKMKNKQQYDDEYILKWKKIYWFEWKLSKFLSIFFCYIFTVKLT